MLYSFHKAVIILKWIVFGYLAAVNVVAGFVTIWDKHRARCGGWRVRERTLFYLAVLGGCPAVYLTMLLIRHKTKHARFMIGLPFLLFLQAVLFLLTLKYVCFRAG